MATLRDVAQRAGVSTSTVSHVVNRTRTVSETLRRRVLAAAQDLDYEPNAMARSLRMRRSNTLGLIVSDLGNPFFTAVVHGVEDAAQENGYELILCNSSEDVAREQAYLRVLISRQVDGLILSPVGIQHEMLTRMVREGFPLVLFDRDVPGLDLSAVMLDNERAAFDAVHHLTALGHSRVGMVSGLPSAASTNSERIAGYRRALEEAGLPEDSRLIAPGHATSEGAAGAVAELLAVTPTPTAIFAANNLMTIGALFAIQQAGLSVPKDIALVGFDDFSWYEVFRPRLTTVSQPTFELGRVAADLLLNLIRSDHAEPTRRIVLRGKLIVRESSGAALESQTPRTLRDPMRARAVRQGAQSLGR